MNKLIATLSLVTLLATPFVGHASKMITTDQSLAITNINQNLPILATEVPTTTHQFTSTAVVQPASSFTNLLTTENFAPINIVDTAFVPVVTVTSGLPGKTVVSTTSTISTIPANITNISTIPITSTTLPNSGKTSVVSGSTLTPPSFVPIAPAASSTGTTSGGGYVTGGGYVYPVAQAPVTYPAYNPVVAVSSTPSHTSTVSGNTSSYQKLTVPNDDAVINEIDASFGNHVTNNQASVQGVSFMPHTITGYLAILLAIIAAIVGAREYQIRNAKKDLQIA